MVPSPPTDSLIKKSKQRKATPASVKKTLLKPLPPATRARAATKAASTKRQQALNKRRAGLPQSAPTPREVPVQLRRPKAKLTLRAARKAAAAPVLAAKTRQQKRRAAAATLDVSNIQRHFATHPTKFDLPKGTNLRITINLNKVKPVVGAK
ncbi:hypothetical protein PybrP1_004433, partial [[Pythium] brassicae (nom. inval.)]